MLLAVSSFRDLATVWGKMEERLTKNRYFFDLPKAMETFAEFVHQDWQRIAGKYDSVRASATRQLISPLLDAAKVKVGMSVLDVGCGPGYIAGAEADRGATSRGLGFFPGNGVARMLPLPCRTECRRPDCRMARAADVREASCHSVSDRRSVRRYAQGDAFLFRKRPMSSPLARNDAALFNR